MVTLSVTLGDP